MASGRADESTGEAKILFLRLPHIFLDIMKILSAYLALVVLAIYLDNNPYLWF